MLSTVAIDISENNLRNRGRVLEILLKDRTTGRNIFWATDSYVRLGKDFAPGKRIKHDQITGVNGKLIQPRAAKPREEQLARTKDKAEVFTPLKIVKEMNIAVDWSSKNFPATSENWVDYISELRLEITCGEAPFIAGRYNPTANTGAIITPKNRVGFLDRKLQVVGEFCKTKKDWLQHAGIALKSSYGYEWQGDNLLIARENILLTMNDFYQDFCENKLKLKSKTKLTTEQLESFAEIISWNIWQMDGIKCVIPMSCKSTIQPSVSVDKNQLGMPFLNEQKPKKVEVECEGCRIGDRAKHTGRYSKIMDWRKGRRVRFLELMRKEGYDEN